MNSVISAGAGAATFCTTVVAAAAMADDPTQCEGVGGAGGGAAAAAAAAVGGAGGAGGGRVEGEEGGGGAEASQDMVTIPSNIGGIPTSVVARNATMSAVSSNTLWEDRCIIQDGDAGEMYFAVLDGHGGWDCAEFAYPLLPAFISQSLSKGVSTGTADVEASITEGFLTVEAMWVKRLKSEWLRDPNYVTYGQPGTERLSSGESPALFLLFLLRHPICLQFFRLNRVAICWRP